METKIFEELKRQFTIYGTIEIDEEREGVHEFELDFNFCGLDYFVKFEQEYDYREEYDDCGDYIDPIYGETHITEIMDENDTDFLKTIRVDQENELIKIIKPC